MPVAPDHCSSIISLRISLDDLLSIDFLRPCEGAAGTVGGPGKSENAPRRQPDTLGS